MRLTAEITSSLNTVSAALWDALVPADNPFLRHAFLLALEASGSVGTPATGWVPAHVLVWDAKALVGAMPLYEKFDSYGEYIFDWAWAQAAYQGGIDYYPKLVSAIPFTPATGARLLYAPACGAPQQADIVAALLQQAEIHAKRCGASGMHLLFTDDPQTQMAQAHGFAPRASFQFHWHAKSHWHNFADYLADLRAPSRKQVKKERAQAQAGSLTLSMRPAAELSCDDWQAMYVFYRQTIYEKGAQAYLTQAFFDRIKITMGEQVIVAMAHKDAAPVAGALFVTAGKHLYGRYWGCLAQYNALHFELCYYMAIDWALKYGIERFEAGAQGEHKLKRGLLPALCRSVHKIYHPGLRHGVEQFLAAEATHVAAHIEQLAKSTPFARPHVETRGD